MLEKPKEYIYRYQKIKSDTVSPSISYEVMGWYKGSVIPVGDTYVGTAVCCFHS